ncbi:hypothetical protein [Oceanirhabdus seepicola]|uniref:Uncharacterized protein n=1 Tax=Oceanirhabdus seepicola TaxID=2828781 RepID=A0A9J6NZL3_9CLOT|nr:hypothetical protein [Oceanirhabdus seepicola]MCM1989983.1 hypothetical protein [Oceanirhabdus seepicola]
MFKNKILLLLTCFCVFLTSVVVNAEALTAKNLSDMNKIIARRQIQKVLSTDGYVAEKSGDYIIVVGESEEGAYNELILFIDDETEIIDTKGNKLSKNKIKNRSAVEVVYKGEETNSFLPCVIAKKVIIKDGVGIEGTVLDIRKADNNSYYYLTIQENKKKYTFIIKENTKLIDKDGNKLSIYDIEKDMNIVGIHHMNSTTSIPSKSYPFKIIVMEDIKENKNILEGMVYDIVDIKNKTGSKLNREAYLRVLGKCKTDDINGKLNVYITKSTNITNENGVKVALKNIKKGSVVEIIYTTKSSDNKQGTPNAEKIIIKNSNGIKGNILKISEYGEKPSILVSGYHQGNNYTQMELILEKNTEIFDIKGKKLSIHDLNKGMQLVGIHGKVSTSRSKHQSLAYTIIVTSEVKDTKVTVEGMIYNIPYSNKKKISIVGEALTENAPNYIDLYINSNTEIVNEEGQKLGLNEIKEGAAIHAVFGQKLSNNKIPTGKAEKIIIKKALGIKGEIINMNCKATFIEVEKSDNHYDNIILKINDDTEIVDLEGKKLSKVDLCKGTKVIGIHSLSATRSIPPQTVAYKIIVLEKGKEEIEHIVEGMVYKVSDYYKNRISIVGEALTEKTPNNVHLYIDNSTEIINEHGDRLYLEDIKEDYVVKAIFGKRLTKNTIPSHRAEKIIIKDALSVKGEISDTNDDRTLIEIEEAEKYYDNIVLKLDKNTEIIDINGEELSKSDLNEGVEVIGIYSIPIINRRQFESLAYKIIILGQSDYDGYYDYYDDDDDDYYDYYDDYYDDDFMSEIFIKGYSCFYDDFRDIMIRVINQCNGKREINEVNEIILEILEQLE